MMYVIDAKEEKDFLHPKIFSPPYLNLSRKCLLSDDKVFGYPSFYSLPSYGDLIEMSDQEIDRLLTKMNQLLHQIQIVRKDRERELSVRI